MEIHAIDWWAPGAETDTKHDRKQRGVHVPAFWFPKQKFVVVFSPMFTVLLAICERESNQPIDRTIELANSESSYQVRRTPRVRVAWDGGRVSGCVSCVLCSIADSIYLELMVLLAH